MKKEGYRWHVHTQGNTEEMYYRDTSSCGDIRRGVGIEFGKNRGVFVVSLKDWFLIGFHCLFGAIQWDIKNIIFLRQDFSSVTGWQKLNKKIKKLIK